MHDSHASETSPQSAPLHPEKSTLKAWIEPELTGISVLATRGSTDAITVDDGAAPPSNYS